MPGTTEITLSLWTTSRGDVAHRALPIRTVASFGSDNPALL
jgi:hypothetical protein